MEEKSPKPSAELRQCSPDDVDLAKFAIDNKSAGLLDYLEMLDAEKLNYPVHGTRGSVTGPGGLHYLVVRRNVPENPAE